MEEFQEKDTIKEPVLTDNSAVVSNEPEGQAVSAPSDEKLILGKFKSVDELTKAYAELEKLQGSQSKELA